MNAEETFVALAEILGPRSGVFLPLMERFKTPVGIFAASAEELRDVAPGLGEGTLAALLKGVEATDAGRICMWCRRNGVKILCYGAKNYPAPLLTLQEPPVVLYCRGELPAGEKDFSVGVVGTRTADGYGAAVSYRFSFEMAAAGAVIVSGMADGIDGIASAAAIDAGGRTVAVLGCGLDIAYPKHHAKLMREIAEHGAVVSEYAPGTRPNGWNFPIRNRLISALSGAVLVVEAGAHSGALITAKYAILQGKALFAVPGDILSPRSEGTNALLREGASIALSAEDVLSHFRFLYGDAVHTEVLPRAAAYSVLTAERLAAHGMRSDMLAPRRKKTAMSEVPPRKTAAVESAVSPELSGLSEKQRALYQKLPAQPFPLDLLTEMGIPAGLAAADMTVLELCGLVRSLPGGMYQKNQITS